MEFQDKFLFYGLVLLISVIVMIGTNLLSVQVQRSVIISVMLVSDRYFFLSGLSIHVGYSLYLSAGVENWCSLHCY